MDAKEIARAQGFTGGVAWGDYDRAEMTQALLDANLDRPRFLVEAPARGAHRGGGRDIFHTNFYYKFDPRSPWLPEQIVDGFRREYEKARGLGWFTANHLMVSVQLDPVTGAHEAPFPEGGRFRDAARRAMTARPASIQMQLRDDADMSRLIDFIAPENRYDAAEGIESEFGNRLSRIHFTVTEYRMPEGRGAAADLGVAPRSIIDLPPVGDGLCGQACLVFATASTTSQVHYRKPERAARLEEDARALAESIGVPGAMSLADFDKYTALHKNTTIIVMEGRSSVMYVSPPPPPRALPAADDVDDNGDAVPFSAAEPVLMTPAVRTLRTIYLLLHSGHYYLIPDMDSFVKPTPKSRITWCHGCRAAVADYYRHACADTCSSCKHTFADAADVAAHCEPSNERCPKCHFKFGFAGCVWRHRCSRWLCTECNVICPMKRAATHACGEFYCGVCDKSLPTMAEGKNHRCFISKPNPRPPAELPNVYAFDIESTLDPRDPANPGGDAVHRIAVVVVVKLYSREVERFAGATAEVDFLRWLGTHTRATTLIAHNASSYDSYLVLSAMRRAHLVTMPSSIVMIGAKIPMIKWGCVRIIDSMRHVAGSLEAFARTFGLQMRKHFFPYRFFTTATLNYIGDVPDKAFFDTVGDDRRAEFDRWHAGFAPGSFSLLDEAVRYCIQDTEILGLALERYRDAAISANGIDPLESVTIASYAQRVYRARHMPPESFPILGRAEYDFARLGLCGGRTDVRQCLRSWSPADVARGNFAAYVDVHSMYPTVQRFDPLPVGAPRWHAAIDGEEACAAFILGLAGEEQCAMIECEVVCPRDLFHPVLVEKKDNRLIASLDITGGVFTSVELALALRHGYRVTSIARALCSRTSTEAFASYVNLFYSMKDRHGTAGADPNPGLCAVAKMMLNSLWGKFGQRDVAVDTKFYTESDTVAWYRAVSRFNSGRLETLTAHEVTDDYIFASSTEPDGERLHLSTTDVLMAAFVTAGARVRLYAELDRHGDRVLYHDTDSVVYERVPGQPDTPIGPALGEWGDDVKGSPAPFAHPITEWVALGPKTYAYRYLRRDGTSGTVVKSKGFSTGFTLESYRELAESFFAGVERAPLSQSGLHFVRAPVKAAHAGEMITDTGFTKKLAVSLGKVHVVSPMRTLPFGHQEIPATA